MAKKKKYEELQEEFIEARAENRGWEELSVADRQRLASRFDVLAQTVKGRGKIARTIYGESPENQPSRRATRKAIKANLPKSNMAAANEATPQVAATNNNQSSPSGTSVYKPPTTSNPAVQNQANQTVDNSGFGWMNREKLPDNRWEYRLENWLADVEIPGVSRVIGPGIPALRYWRPMDIATGKSVEAFGKGELGEGFKQFGNAFFQAGLGALDVGLLRAGVSLAGRGVVAGATKIVSRSTAGRSGAAGAAAAAQSAAQRPVRPTPPTRGTTTRTAPASASAVASSTERTAATSAETRLATTETATTPTPAAGSAPKATGGRSARRSRKASDETRNVTITEVAPATTPPPATASPTAPPATATAAPIAPPTAGGTAPTTPHVNTRTPDEIVGSTTATPPAAPKGKGGKGGKKGSKPKDKAVIEEVKPGQPKAEEVVGGTNPKVISHTKPSTSSPTTSSPSVTESTKNSARTTNPSSSPKGSDAVTSPSGNALPKDEPANRTSRTSSADSPTTDPATQAEIDKLVAQIPPDPVIPELPKLTKKEIADLTPEQLRARAELKKEIREKQALARKYTDQRKAFKDVERIEYIIDPKTGLPVINPVSKTPWRRIVYKKPSQLEQERLQRRAERAAEKARRKAEDGLGEGVTVEEVGGTTPTDAKSTGAVITDATTGELVTPAQNVKFFEAAKTKDGYPDTLGGQELKQREANEYSQAYARWQFDQLVGTKQLPKPTPPRPDLRAEEWKKIPLTAEELAEEAAKTPKQRRRERIEESRRRRAQKADPKYDEYYESLTPEQRQERIEFFNREFERKKNEPPGYTSPGRTPKEIEEIQSVKERGARLAKSPERVAAEKALEQAEELKTRQELAMRVHLRDPKVGRRQRRRYLAEKPVRPPDDGRQPLHSFSQNDIKETLRERVGSFYDQINDDLAKSRRVESTQGSTLMDELYEKQKAMLEEIAAKPPQQGVESFVTQGMDYETLLRVEQQFDFQQIRNINPPYGRTRPVKEAVFRVKPKMVDGKKEYIPVKQKDYDAMMQPYQMTREDLLRLIGSDLGRK